MKMFCFNFNQNRTINKEFDFWGGQILSGGPEGGRGTRFQQFEKISYRTVVSTHIENFSIPALLRSVQKSGELNRLLRVFRPPKGWAAVRFQNSEKKTHIEQWYEPTAKISAP